MCTKTIQLSSDGLKNIVPGACQEGNEFQFIYTDQIIKMNPIYAEFISPIVSNMHHIDPTINSLVLDDHKKKCDNQISQILSEDVVTLLKRISCGYSIEINEEQGFKLKLISVLLQNQELFNLINENFPSEINEANLDYYLQDLLFYHNQKEAQSHSLNYSNIINYISKNFYSIDQEKLKKLPKSILYSIITNENLILENEDSLLSFIQKIFESNEEEENEEEENYNDENSDENFNIVSFYEAINFLSLSETKFQEFVENFESTKMTKLLWSKLNPCFYIYHSHKSQKQHKSRYSTKERYTLKDRHFDYDGTEEHGFNGIIHQLTEESGGNVSENGTVKVTSSPTNGNDVTSKNAVDFDDINHYFQSTNELNSWLKYDFQDSSVRPTYYTIRTRPEGGKGDNHPKNWVIEGSNTDNDENWKVLDSRNDVTVLDDSNIVHTFQIQTPLMQNESFRYLRIRATGPNTQKGNYYFLTLSALEYFGILYSK